MLEYAAWLPRSFFTGGTLCPCREVLVVKQKHGQIFLDYFILFCSKAFLIVSAICGCSLCATLPSAAPFRKPCSAEFTAWIPRDCLKDYRSGTFVWRLAETLLLPQTFCEEMLLQSFV